MGNISRRGPLEDYVREENNMDRRSILLGPSRSCKSTLFKQISARHVPLEPSDQHKYHVLKSCATLVKLAHANNISTAAYPSITEDLEYYHAPFDFQANAQEIDRFWQDEHIRAVYDKCKYTSNEPMTQVEYFMSRALTYADPNYVPTFDDIIRGHTRTTGILSTHLNYGDRRVDINDVGGPRNERKKWIHCFNDLSSLFFLVPLDSYNLKCWEDDTTSQIAESICSFEDVANSKFMSNCAIILLFTMIDIFHEKIKQIPITCSLSEYTGNSEQAAIEYIIEQFVSRTDAKRVYPFVINALDPKEVENLIAAIEPIVLNKSDPGFVFKHHRLTEKEIRSNVLRTQSFSDITLISAIK